MYSIIPTANRVLVIKHRANRFCLKKVMERSIEVLFVKRVPVTLKSLSVLHNSSSHTTKLPNGSTGVGSALSNGLKSPLPATGSIESPDMNTSTLGNSSHSTSSSSGNSSGNVLHQEKKHPGITVQVSLTTKASGRFRVMTRYSMEYKVSKYLVTNTNPLFINPLLKKGS